MILSIVTSSAPIRSQKADNLTLREPPEAA
jgi:hypothetical protein